MKKNNKTGSAIKQVEQGRVISFSSVDEMMKSLEGKPSKRKPPKEPKRDYSKPSVKSMYGYFEYGNRFKTWTYRKKMERQRRKNGFCDYDTYAFDYWFVFHVAAMIDNVRNNRFGIGVPADFACQFYRDHQEKYGDAGEIAATNGMSQEFAWFYGAVEPKERHVVFMQDAQKAWEDMLEEMVFLFRESDESMCSRQNPYEYGDEKYKATEDELWAYREKCRTKAFSLLNRWFMSLAI